MVMVQLRDIANQERILLENITLPFEPREGVPIYVWDHFEDRKIGFWKRPFKRGFVIDRVLQYEVSTTEPERSGIVYLAHEIRH
jgi:hypothetical protein